MANIEMKNEIPPLILTSLEDLTTDLLDLQELVLAIAASADYLPLNLSQEFPEPVQ